MIDESNELAFGVSDGHRSSDTQRLLGLANDSESVVRKFVANNLDASIG